MPEPLINPEEPADEDYEKASVFVPREEDNNTSSCRDMFATGLGVFLAVIIAITAIVTLI